MAEAFITLSDCLDFFKMLQLVFDVYPKLFYDCLNTQELGMPGVSFSSELKMHLFDKNRSFSSKTKVVSVEYH